MLRAETLDFDVTNVDREDMDDPVHLSYCLDECQCLRFPLLRLKLTSGLQLCVSILLYRSLPAGATKTPFCPAAEAQTKNILYWFPQRLQYTWRPIPCTDAKTSSAKMQIGLGRGDSQH